jgi:hypothetical protein
MVRKGKRTKGLQQQEQLQPVQLQQLLANSLNNILVLEPKGNSSNKVVLVLYVDLLPLIQEVNHQR